MSSRFHSYLILISMTLVGVAYGFYIMTSDDSPEDLERAYPYQSAYLMDIDGDTDDMAVLKNLYNTEPEPSVQLLNQDDLEYIDRANRLENALRQKRAIVELADEYSQNFMPDDLDGLRLVRSTLPQELPQDLSMPVYYHPFQKRVPMSYIVIE